MGFGFRHRYLNLEVCKIMKNGLYGCYYGFRAIILHPIGV